VLDGTVPADLTITTLGRGLPYSWAEQERQVGTQSLGTTPASLHPAEERRFAREQECSD
jgi:hypothetical protein